jgi:hypothetical protein
MTAQPQSIAALKKLEAQIKDGLSSGSVVIRVRCDNGESVAIAQLRPIKSSEDFDIVV